MRETHPSLLDLRTECHVIFPDLPLVGIGAGEQLSGLGLDGREIE
jgi:hypothetical protein